MSANNTPSLNDAQQMLRAALHDFLTISSVECEIQHHSASDDPDDLQNAVNKAAAYMRGIAAGHRWLAEALFEALTKDGFIEQSTAPSHALYLIEAVLLMSKDSPEISVQIGGGIH